MSLFLAFIAGCFAYYLFQRWILRFVRKQFKTDAAKAVRKNLLDGMGYDSLVTFEAAVQAELAKRRGAKDEVAA
jgi:hypothetical protein